jgi:hypothetical protein
MLEDSKHGLGVLLTNTSCFEGFFENNWKKKGFEMDIKGIYRGHFGGNLREGTGEYEAINGDYYVGDWKEGVEEGNGFWSNKQGDSYTG